MSVRPSTVLLDALNHTAPLVSVELRPPRAELGTEAGMDAWIHTSLPTLNGQTPIQASTHEFGRRKLHYLLREMARHNPALEQRLCAEGMAGDKDLPGMPARIEEIIFVLLAGGDVGVLRVLRALAFGGAGL
jgi:hypothetical protein